MDETRAPSHWLYRYGNPSHYQWRTRETGDTGRTTYHRPLGLVESAFDSDGRYYEGRADMNMQLDLEARSNLNDEDFRERILFAWTALRCRHLLVQAKAVSEKDLGLDDEEKSMGREMHFTVDAPRTVGQAVEDAGKHLIFVGDHFKSVVAKDFWMHCQNTGRVIDSSQALAKMFILPPERLPNGQLGLKLLVICSHQVCDGLAMSIWLRSLVHLLNLSLCDLRQQIQSSIEPSALFSRLPQAQEALYPPIPGTRARQRWFWLLTRILRHVRRPLPAAFPNPLRRPTPKLHSTPFSPTYAPVLDYTTPPALLNTFPCTAKLSHTSTRTLHRLCREAHTSIGAGCFALAAAIMMEFHEARHPRIPLSDRKPFITGFPLNPRAFFNHHVDPDSLMLGFSDGILLPFLPSDLPVEGRIKLLARRAHRQLATFQKRAGTKVDTAGLSYMGSRGAGRLLPVHYIASLERWRAKLPEGEGRGADGMTDPQGGYPMRPNITGQTCGVSSVGSKVSVLKRGMVSLQDNEEEQKDFAADFRASHASVRPRDDEFLVGIGGDDESTIGMNASVDANAIDPVLARAFCERFENILEGDDEGGGPSAKL